MMNLLRISAAALLILTSQAHADVEVYKSKEGVVLVSNNSGQNFTLEIKGKQITPIGQDSSPNPMFMVDGQFLQVAVVRIKDFKGDASKPEAETLKKYLAYESEFYKGHLQDVVAKPELLAKDREALGWTANTVPSAEVAKAQTNVMLAFVHDDYVVNLGTSVEKGKSTDNARKSLATIARSFVGSKKKITLKFAADGSYSRE